MRFQNGKKQGIYWARCGLPGTKPIINVAELGLGERAVTISDDSGGWIWLYEVGFLKVKACFWADLLDRSTDSIRKFRQSGGVRLLSEDHLLI
jgi:hypothetical protein